MTDICTPTTRRRHPAAHLALATAVAMALLGGRAAQAQAVNGSIEGHAPVASGESVKITNNTGFTRVVAIGPSGTYSVTVPVGTYTVELIHGGRVVQTHRNVAPVAAGSVTVNFAASHTAQKSAETLAAVNVTAAQIPPIDFSSSVATNTVTREELDRLPLARNYAAISLLAPGVTLSSPSIGVGNLLGNPLISIGGGTEAENAFYVDGMNVTDAVNADGAVTLPYFAISQQQTLTTGYSAKYGRSMGGVVSQIGRSGSNKWHFGLRAEWEPTWGRSTEENEYWRNPLSKTPHRQDGDLMDYRRLNSGWQTVYDGYVSGPIIKNRLFFFFGIEKDVSKGNSVGNFATPATRSFTTSTLPKLYAKINWTINSNNYLSLTAFRYSRRAWTDNYHFDYSDLSTGSLGSVSTVTKRQFTTWVANYTSYLTDKLTLHAMFGKYHQAGDPYVAAVPGLDPLTPAVLGLGQQNPALVPAGGRGNLQTVVLSFPESRNENTDYRVSLSYHIVPSNKLTVGIDNIQSWINDDGAVSGGPGYYWVYGQSDPTLPVLGTAPGSPPFVGPLAGLPNGTAGYYVTKNVFDNEVSVRTLQTAQYVEDAWNITPNLRLNLGLRNDAYVNYNPAGQPYIKLTKPQWQPRLGFNWNIGGSNTMSLFGNVGRYYLDLPLEVARNMASGILQEAEYFTYGGVNELGEPTGLTPVPSNPTGFVPSASSENGQPPDPRTIAATNLKGQYGDMAVVGFKRAFGASDRWVGGVTATYTQLGNVIDNWADTRAICNAAVAQGFTSFTSQNCASSFTSGSVLINPGKTADLLVKDPKGGLDRVVITPETQGFALPPRRHYYSLDFSLQRIWDGKWGGRADFVYSRSYGNEPGNIDTATGQGGGSASVTELWDFSQIMDYADGLQSNDQKYQLKLYGSYKFSPSWLLSANVFIGSGHPTVCLGGFGPGQTDPVGYGDAYHWCGGHPAPPGTTGFSPWTHQVNVNVKYFPPGLHHRLDLSMAVFNIFNEQSPRALGNDFGTTFAPNPGWLEYEGIEPPRLIRFAASYNF
ncbi:MAG TPA: TonB-dependent receptor [Rhodanobacteraceae bacterium]